MGNKNHRNGLEIEGGCRLAEAGGMAAGVGEGYAFVKYWMEMAGVEVPPCRDGVAQSGEQDQLGRPLQRGRGLGLFDDLWPVVIPALAGHPYPAIIEMVPVNFKGSKSDPYAVFEKMLKRGNPPDDWKSLVAASRFDWSKEKR